MRKGGRHYVYCLIDPRFAEDRWIFYIGISMSPWTRFDAHRRDRNSSAWDRIQEIMREGYLCEMQIIAVFDDRDDAWELEHKLICETPNLVNRDRRQYRVFRYAA